MKKGLWLLIFCSQVFGANPKAPGTERAYAKEAKREKEEEPVHIMPPVNAKVKEGSDLYASLDFIYWTMRQDGLPYAFTGFGSTTERVDKGKYQYDRRRWSPGFKVGVGLIFSHDGWDMGLQYTWLNSPAKNRSTNAFDIYPNWNIANSQNSPTKFNDGARAGGAIYRAQGSWKMSYNVIDLELGRAFRISPQVEVRPFIGFKGAWNTERYIVLYNLVDSSDTGRFERGTMDQLQRYWGLGIRTGAETAWHFSKAWSLFGNTAFSEMWSQFKTHRKDTLERLPLISNDPDVIFWSKNSAYGLKEVVELAVGVRWEKLVNNGLYVTTQVAWEEQLWINFGQWARVMGEQTNGDLSLQGLTAKLRLDF